MKSVQTTDVEILSFDAMKKAMLPRSSDSHKGDYGHVLLVGGAPGYAGAICLAGESALRAGAGLVSIATQVEHASIITITRPELMCHGVDSQVALKKLAKHCNVVAVGPGLGKTKWSQRMLEVALDLKLPIIIDADGLNILSADQRKCEQWVLTPHPGEAARLLKCKTRDVQQDRVSAIQEIQQIYGGVVVLKGAGSLIYDGTGAVYQCQAGNPGMASGGMGDVLTGVIVGLVAQGHGLLGAAKLGVLIHAIAGDRAAKSGQKGMLASDLIQHIRELVNES
jgi:hydroxyethylthiazole kinase-like uncharacterized protein yjeF